MHLNINYVNKKDVDIVIKGRSISPKKDSRICIDVMDNGLVVQFLYDSKEKRGYVR